MPDKELMDILQTIVDNMATKDDLNAVKNDLAEVKRVTATKEDVDESRRHTEILIETKITQRLDALTDGYKLNHEKQYDLEREVAALKARVEALEIRTA